MEKELNEQELKNVTGGISVKKSCSSYTSKKTCMEHDCYWANSSCKEPMEEMFFGRP